MAPQFLSRVASAVRRLWRGSARPPQATASSGRAPDAEDYVRQWTKRAPTAAVLVSLGVGYTDKKNDLEVQRCHNVSLEDDNMVLKEKIRVAQVQEKARGGHGFSASCTFGFDPVSSSGGEQRQDSGSW